MVVNKDAQESTKVSANLVALQKLHEVHHAERAEFVAVEVQSCDVLRRGEA